MHARCSMRERGPQLGASAVDPAANGAGLDPENDGDLLISQAVNVVQQHGGPVVRTQCGQGIAHVVVEGAVKQQLLDFLLSDPVPLDDVFWKGVQSDAPVPANLVAKQVHVWDLNLEATLYP